MKLHKKRPVLTSQFQVSKLQKQLPTVIQIHLDQCANFGPLPLNVCVTVSHNVCVQHHKSLKVTQNAINRDKHVNETFKQIFANNLVKISYKNMQDKPLNWNVCFNVFT